MGMDYILGRNPLDQSFVTGCGDRPLRIRITVSGATRRTRSTRAAAGRAVGRPELRDSGPVHAAAGLNGCAPQKCFMDNGEAWSANEVTINWNAPLAWVSAYLDEQEGPKPAAAAGAEK